MCNERQVSRALSAHDASSDTRSPWEASISFQGDTVATRNIEPDTRIASFRSVLYGALSVYLSFTRDAGKALEERKEKAAEKAEEVVEAVEQALPEVDGSAEDVADSLEIEQGSPQALAIMLGKVAVVSGRTKAEADI